MKQHSLFEGHAKREWKATTRPWNAMSLADEAIAGKQADESTVGGNIEVPIRFINAMSRMGFIGEKQDWREITEFMLSCTENKLFGRIKGKRYA